MFEKFYKIYDEETFEAVVLIQKTLGMGHCGDYGDMNGYMLGLVKEDGTVITGKLRLSWPIPVDASSGPEGFSRFKDVTCYRLRLSAMTIDPEADKHRQEYQSNCFCLREVLGEAELPEQLRAIRDDYLEDVVIDDDVLGKLTLDKDMESFAGEYTFGDDEFQFYLDSDEANVKSCTESLAHGRAFVSRLEELDKRMREYACQELYDDAVSWQEDADEDEQQYPDGLKKEDFIKVISLSEVSFALDGAVTVYYDDGDLFYGHVIVVEYNITTDTFESAYIAG